MNSQEQIILTNDQEQRFRNILKFYKSITCKDSSGGNLNEIEFQFYENIIIYIKKTFYHYVLSVSGIFFIQRLQEMKDFLINNDLFNQAYYDEFINHIDVEIKKAITDLAQISFNPVNSKLFDLLLDFPNFDECFLDVEKQFQDEFLRQLKIHKTPSAVQALQIRKILGEFCTQSEINYNCPVVIGCLNIIRYKYTYPQLFMDITAEFEEELKLNLTAYLKAWSIPRDSEIQVNSIVKIDDKYTLIPETFTSIEDFVHSTFLRLNKK